MQNKQYVLMSVREITSITVDANAESDANTKLSLGYTDF
jgi:hypothetical protein